MLDRGGRTLIVAAAGEQQRRDAILGGALGVAQ